VYIRLHHEQPVATMVQVAIPGTHPATGDPGRRQTGSVERLDRHRGGGRLSVYACDSDEFTAGDSLSERLRTPHDRESQLAGTKKLRMVLRHCGRDDKCMRSVDVRGVVALVQHEPEASQIVSPAELRIATGDADST